MCRFLVRQFGSMLAAFVLGIIFGLIPLLAIFKPSQYREASYWSYILAYLLGSVAQSILFFRTQIMPGMQPHGGIVVLFSLSYLATFGIVVKGKDRPLRSLVDSVGTVFESVLCPGVRE